MALLDSRLRDDLGQLAACVVLDKMFCTSCVYSVEQNIPLVF